MPEILTARLSGPVSQPEVSLMWESERATDSSIAPEMVLYANRNEVTLTFPSSGSDPEHRELKRAFERAVKRYRPELTIEWPTQAMSAG